MRRGADLAASMPEGGAVKPRMGDGALRRCKGCARSGRHAECPVEMDAARRPRPGGWTGVRRRGLRTMGCAISTGRRGAAAGARFQIGSTHRQMRRAPQPQKLTGYPVWLSFWQSVSRRGYGVWSLVGRAVQSPSTDPVRSARGAFLLVLVQQGPDRHRCEGRAGPARRRATRRSRVGTPLPVPTGPVPKRSVPTRLRRVAHSNGRAIRLGIRTAVNACRPAVD